MSNDKTFAGSCGNFGVEITSNKEISEETKTFISSFFANNTTKSMVEKIMAEAERVDTNKLFALDNGNKR